MDLRIILLKVIAMLCGTFAIFNFTDSHGTNYHHKSVDLTKDGKQFRRDHLQRDDHPRVKQNLKNRTVEFMSGEIPSKNLTVI